jgi:hypothetical protein
MSSGGTPPARTSPPVSDKSSTRLCSISGLWNGCTLRDCTDGGAGGGVRIISDEGDEGDAPAPRAPPPPAVAQPRAPSPLPQARGARGRPRTATRVRCGTAC